jgi:hypothetical protein
MKQLRIPPLLIDIVQSGLSACEGIVFDNRDACPVCGGALSGYDTKKKQFAVMLEGNTRHQIHVFVKRFSCRRCHAICFADEPFYPDTRLGSPVIDLCVTLAATMPFTRTATYIASMGIFIDRGSVRNNACRGFLPVPTTDIFGIRLPLSLITLSTLASSVVEGGRIEGTEALAACGFPSAHRAAPDHLLLPEHGNDRKEEEDKEERQTDHL